MTELDEARCAAYLLDPERAARMFKRCEIGVCPRCAGSGVDPVIVTLLSPGRSGNEGGRWVPATCDLCAGRKHVTRNPRPRHRWQLLPAWQVGRWA